MDPKHYLRVNNRDKDNTIDIKVLTTKDSIWLGKKTIITLF